MNIPLPKHVSPRTKTSSFDKRDVIVWGIFILCLPLTLAFLFGALLFVQVFMAGVTFLVLYPFAFVARHISMLIS